MTLLNSAAGFLKAYIGLVTVWLLCVPAAGRALHRPAERCACKEACLAELIEHNMKTILHKYVTYNNVTILQEKFPHLDVNFTSNHRGRLAICGTSYVLYALEHIHEHQKHLNSDKQFLQDFTHVRNYLKNLKNSLPGTWQKDDETCDHNPKYPNEEHTYKRKQWGRVALKHSLKFMKDLFEYLNVEFCAR